MISRFTTGAKSTGSSALDMPVAALAGLSVAFVLYAMPDELFSSLVEATGLPSFWSAAQPPLGGKARAIASLAGAVVVFELVFLLLRLLDRVPRRAKEVESVEEPPRQRSFGPRAEAIEEEVPAPRLRRLDAHPDAPARRPIFAISDIGEPSKPSETSSDKPFWNPEDFPVEDEEEQQALAAAWEVEVDAPVAADDPEPEAGDPVMPEPVAQPVAEAEPVTLQPQPVEQPEPLQAPISVEPAPASATPSTPQGAAGRPAFGESIPDLMARLEQGLAAKRAQKEAIIPAAPQKPERQPAPAADDRLKSAIDHLQRMAAKGL